MKEFFTLTDASKGFIQIVLIILAIWLIAVVVRRLTGKNVLPIQDANGDIPLNNLTIHDKLNPTS